MNETLKRLLAAANSKDNLHRVKWGCGGIAIGTAASVAWLHPTAGAEPRDPLTLVWFAMASGVLWVSLAVAETPAQGAAISLVAMGTGLIVAAPILLWTAVTALLQMLPGGREFTDSVGGVGAFFVTSGVLAVAGLVVRGWTLLRRKPPRLESTVTYHENGQKMWTSWTSCG